MVQLIWPEKSVRTRWKAKSMEECQISLPKVIVTLTYTDSEEETFATGGNRNSTFLIGLEIK